MRKMTKANEYDVHYIPTFLDKCLTFSIISISIIIVMKWPI